MDAAQLNHPGDELDAALTAFLQLTDWREWRAVIEQRPVLLTDKADQAMALLIDAATANQDPDAVSEFRNRRTLLRRCREVGVEAAIAELASEAGVPAELADAWGAAERAQVDAQSRDPAALDAAVTAFRALVEHPAFAAADRSAQARVWYGLGVFEAERYQAGAPPQALDRAIDAFRTAVDTERADGPDAAGYLAMLGTSLGLRYERAGRPDDVDDGIDALTTALAALPADAEDRPALLHDLAATLARRYEDRGHLEDLKRSLAATDEAIERADPELLPVLLTGLVNGLVTRYERVGDVADLQIATRRAHDALAQGAGTRHEPALLATVGGAELELWDRLRTDGGLERAIEHLATAAEALAESSPMYPGCLNSLGAARLARFERDGAAKDLVAAEAAYAAALDPLDAGAVERPRMEVALARVQLHGTPDAAATAAIAERLDAALLRLPEDAPDRSVALATVAHAHRLRHELSGDPAALAAAVDAYRAAAGSGLTAQLDVALSAARDWGEWADARAAWHEAAEAYAVGLRAADRLFALQVGRPEKEVWLGAAAGLAARAAAALIRTGDPAAAAEALERGRARLLGEALARDRADLAALRALRPDLADRYQRAADTVRANDHSELAAADPELQSETRAERLRQARTELDAVIALIKKVDGYHEFLAAADFAELAALAAEQPLVYIAAGADRGDAVVIGRDGQARAVPLPDLTDEALRTRAAAFLDGARGGAAAAAVDEVTAWLWPAVMHPVLAAIAPADRLTIIPVGLLAVLPLHAAWREAPTGRHYALDDALITYAPSARALRDCRARAAGAATDALVAIDDPAGLRYAAAEVDAIVPRFAATTRLTAGDTATADAVLAALPGADVAHFACHGTARMEDPMSSGLELGGEQRLDLRAILTAPTLRARLAVLSACETARPGTGLPDELVGLPAGFIQAGVAGVVGSLWRVPDRTTMELVTRFYAEWRTRSPDDPAQALRRAQIAVRDALAGASADAARHVGEEEVVAPAASAFSWAGFVYVGA